MLFCLIVSPSTCLCLPCHLCNSIESNLFRCRSFAFDCLVSCFSHHIEIVAFRVRFGLASAYCSLLQHHSRRMGCRLLG